MSGFFGALIAAAVIAVTTGESPGVQSASTEQPAATTPAAAPEETPSVVFIGDSWTFGTGASALHGYAVLTAERLGWNYDLLGVGGSGYVRPGRGSPFEQRIDRAIALDPDVIVVQGSINERPTSLDVLAPAALRTLTELRTEADEDTAILVVGASYVPGADSATIAGINQTIGDAAVSAGLPFVDPAAENWSDPADPTIWADPLHVNDRGAEIVADHLAPLLEDLVGD